MTDRTGARAVHEPTSEEAGPRWSFMRVRRIRGRDGSTYLWRLYLISTPWFGVMLHRIFRPDNQRDLHDHPWNFLSIILLGWYSEYYQRDGEPSTFIGIRNFWRWNWKRAEDRHSIRHVGRVPVWTLVFTGVRRRKWGFWVTETHGVERWVPYDQYEKLNDA